jgi:SAM-dependent methyltransferase
LTDRAFWEAKYHNRETGWDRGGSSPALSIWLKELQPCRILIPGCGRGHEVLELTRRGFEVTGLDIAAPAIEHLQAALDKDKLTATLVHGDLFDVKLEPFDAIYEQTCLCTIHPDRWPDYEQWAYTHLKPGGQLLAQFMQVDADEDGPPFNCGIPEMKNLFAPSRWLWPESEGKIIPHHSGRHELAHLLTRI